MKELEGKVAVVSGAGRGQGRAIPHAMAGAGARVVAGDVRIQALAALATELGDGNSVVGELDVRERQGWDALLARGADTFGRIDILVNNAGILRQVALDDEAPEAFEDVWRVNCLGAFHGIQAVVPHLRRSGGGRSSTRCRRPRSRPGVTTPHMRRRSGRCGA